MECKEHDFVVLEKDITTVEEHYYNSIGSADNIQFEGYALLYCRKCAEIKKVVIDDA